MPDGGRKVLRTGEGHGKHGGPSRLHLSLRTLTLLVGGEGGCDDEASEFGAQCRSGCVSVGYDAHIPVTGSAEWDECIVSRSLA